MAKGVRRNEVLDIYELGLLFLVNTCDPEIKKQVYFILYRLSLTGLIKFYHRITPIQNNFFYIEPLAISHKTESMEPDIPEKDFYFLKSEIIKRQAVIKSNIQDLMDGSNKDDTGKHTKTSYLKFISYLVKKYKVDVSSKYATGKIKKGMEEIPEIALDEKTIRGILQEIQQFKKADTGKN